jgi:hypothetical protein
MEGKGVGEAQGVADPQKSFLFLQSDQWRFDFLQLDI